VPKDGAGHSSHLVVVGSSAGGVEALGVLLSGLPADFPAPVVIAQHLDPRRPSQLQSVLERKSVLRVATINAHTRLEPGRVYVVPADRHVVILDGEVKLESDHAARPRPSVDLLLTTAARSYGDRLIAVILTGSGTDGAAGAVEVKAAGGVVIIQNPETAAYPSMPLALPPTAVDHVADLEAIAPLLHDLLAGAPPPEETKVENNALPELLGVISRQANIDFKLYKPQTLLRRISRRMALTHKRTLHEYRDHLTSNPAEMPELLKSIIMKVTEFFRDPEAFAFLKTEILPRLLERGRERGNELRLWSAGCATGEEAFSLAMLVADVLGPDLHNWNVKLFATDVDAATVGFARRALYPETVLRNVPADYKSRFFERSEQGFRVTRTVRQMVIFGQQDLSRGIPFPRIDLVVCRNLLIYFKPELQQDVLDLFAFSLAPTNGYLFLGKAESIRPSSALFEPHDKKWRIYRCLAAPGGRAAEAAAPVRAPKAAAVRPAVDAAGPRESAGRETELEAFRRFNELVLRHLSAGIALIDREYRIHTINPAARRLLGIREPATGRDFLHTARGLPYSDLRHAVDSVFRERTSTSMPETSLESPELERRRVRIAVSPLRGDGTKTDLAVVTIHDATEAAQARHQLSAIQSEHQQLLDELSASNKRLTDLNKELEATNEELQSTNEEMMLAQEELQATNEEFEATNEELQSTNEELETNNEELQATNEELETTNDELSARTAELQELTRMLMTERQRLKEMVAFAPFYIVVLRGPDLLVETLNPPSGILFGGGEAVGRPFAEICCPPELQVLMDKVREVQRTDEPWTSDRLTCSLVDSNGPTTDRAFVFKVVPNHDTAGKVDGVAVYAEDVTDKAAEAGVDREDKLRVVIEHASDIALALYDGGTTELLYGSPRYFDLLARTAGLEREGALQTRWGKLGLDTEGNSEAFADVVRNGSAHRIREVRVKGPDDGSESVWNCNLIPVPGDRAGDRVRFVMVSAVDVTDQVHAREELERVDHMKDEFLAMASHELRTPLVPLTTYAEVLSRTIAEKRHDGEWGSKAEEIVEKFRKQLAYLQRMTEDLIDVARLETGRLALDRKPMDLRQVLRDATETAAHIAPSPKVHLSLPSGEGPVAVNGDEVRVMQVVINLLSNALQYASDSERIELRLDVDGADRAVIEVQDSGPGIPPEQVASLFDRYSPGRRPVRPGRQGLGLGLQIAKSIVDQHGGSITVDSKVGRGTTFRIELPLDGAKGP
jgi:two-component system CheB/CheR fusion protein